MPSTASTTPLPSSMTAPRSWPARSHPWPASPVPGPCAPAPDPPHPPPACPVPPPACLVLRSRSRKPLCACRPPRLHRMAALRLGAENEPRVIRVTGMVSFQKSPKLPTFLVRRAPFSCPRAVPLRSWARCGSGLPPPRAGRYPCRSFQPGRETQLVGAPACASSEWRRLPAVPRDTLGLRTCCACEERSVPSCAPAHPRGPRRGGGALGPGRGPQEWPHGQEWSRLQWSPALGGAGREESVPACRRTLCSCPRAASSRPRDVQARWHRRPRGTCGTQGSLTWDDANCLVREERTGETEVSCGCDSQTQPGPTL